MEPRTTQIRLGGASHEIYCDNATLLRFEDAGGDFRRFDAKPLRSVALFIQANLVTPGPFKSAADIVNAIDSFDEAAEVVNAIMTGSTFFSPTGEKKSGESGAIAESGPKALSASG